MLFERFVNRMVTIDGERGSANETISARAFRLRRKHPNLFAFMNALHFWEDDHCLNCWINEHVRI